MHRPFTNLADGAAYDPSPTVEKERSMRSSSISSRVVLVATALLVLASASAANSAGAKKFTWTTKSKEAADLASQIVVQIESMSVTPATQAQAQKIVELAPEFAFGHYLVATFNQGQNPDVVKQANEKAVAL